MSRSSVVAPLITAFLFVGFAPHVPVAKRAYVTPHALFLNENARTTQMTIGASGDEPEEATIDVQFGFPDVDAFGTPFVRLIEDPGPEFPSAAGWIRPFPRRVRLEPGQKQIVRILAVPPDSLPDGEYWTRVIVTSSGISAPVMGSDSTVQAGLNVVLRLITSLTYRKGDVHTGLNLEYLEVETYPDSIVAWVEAAPEGNGGYLGTATFELVDPDGSVVEEWPVPIAVYYPFRRRFKFRLPRQVQGDYRVRLRVETVRRDLADGQVLPAPTVRDSVEIRIP